MPRPPPRAAALAASTLSAKPASSRRRSLPVEADSTAASGRAADGQAHEVRQGHRAKAAATSCGAAASTPPASVVTSRRPLSAVPTESSSAASDRTARERAPDECEEPGADAAAPSRGRRSVVAVGHGRTQPTAFLGQRRGLAHGRAQTPLPREFTRGASSTSATATSSRLRSLLIGTCTPPGAPGRASHEQERGERQKHSAGAASAGRSHRRAVDVGHGGIPRPLLAGHETRLVQLRGTAARLVQLRELATRLAPLRGIGVEPRLAQQPDVGACPAQLRRREACPPQLGCRPGPGSRRPSGNSRRSPPAAPGALGAPPGWPRSRG